jgi:RNA polymerase sigma-70 factor (ECF subfamily)
MNATEAFEAERPRLKRLAYRMLGEVSEAEDVVQDAWLRWRDARGIDNPSGFLTQVVSRLCLDRLKSARARRETYVGPWLPEPLVEEEPDDPVERAEDVSVAFLLALERLSPLERAAFLLRDVFDADFSQVAEALGRSELAVRQLASRAREHLKAAKPRFAVAREEAERLSRAFMAAIGTQDWTSLAGILAEDAVMITDGGGKRKAALRPLVGVADVLAFLRGISARGNYEAPTWMRPVRVNGLPGFIVSDPQGLGVWVVEPGEGGRIAAIYGMRNPDKLRHLDDVAENTTDSCAD